jgi:hypothetical protein
MRCEYCNSEINGDEARYAHSNVYCESCFEESFTYCSRCDAVIARNDANYDDCGDAFCQSCYDENYDEDAPNNPEVNDLDRQLIIHLSRNWLKGKVDNRKPIEINESDPGLKEIRNQLSLVEKPLYCYGLLNREDYDITASFELIDAVKKYLSENHLNYKVQFCTGTRRVGVSENLRADKLDLIVNLLKTLTSNKQASTEAA